MWLRVSTNLRFKIYDLRFKYHDENNIDCGGQAEFYEGGTDY